MGPCWTELIVPANSRADHGRWRQDAGGAFTPYDGSVTVFALGGLNVEVPLATRGLCDDTTLAMDGGRARWSDARPGPDRPGRGRPGRRATTATTTPSTSCWSASRWPGCASTSRRSSRSPTPTAATDSPGCRATTGPSTTWSSGSGPPGYKPVVQPFDYLAFAELGPSALQQTAPGTVTYVQGVDFGVIDQSDPGDVTAAVTAVDLQLGLGNTSTSGCEAADFAGFPAGNIALLQRGHVHVRAEGRERRRRRRHRHRDLQPGQHRRRPTARASRRSPSRPTTPAASRCSAPPMRWA